MICCIEWFLGLRLIDSGRAWGVQNGLLVFVVMEVREVEEVSESMKIGGLVEGLKDEQHGHKTK